MEKLLIIKPSSLGDIVHGLQIAATIKHFKPDLEISWVVREVFAPIVEACEEVDKVYIFNRKGGISGFLKLVWELRHQKFDWIFDLQGLARSGLITALSRSRNKIGRSDSRECAGLAYHWTVPMPEKGKRAHAMEILLPFLRELDIPEKLKGDVTFGHIEVSKAVDPSLLDKQPILIFPNSRRAEKEWPYFVELTDALLTAYPEETVVWVGQNALPENADWPKERFYNLLGKTELLDMVALLQNARCVVTNDSGPMHIAAAMGVKLVCLFGPTKPSQYGPYPLDKEMHHVLQAPKGDLSKLEMSAVLKALKFLKKDE